MCSFYVKTWQGQAARCAGFGSESVRCEPRHPDWASLTLNAAPLLPTCYCIPLHLTILTQPATMGILKFTLFNIALSSFALGALKSRGAITVKPEQIKNEYVRYAFVSMTSLGESAYVSSTNFIASLNQKPK